MAKRISHDDISTEKIPHSGAVKVSAFVPGGPWGEYLHTETYYGYTIREARQAFYRQVNSPEFAA